MHHVARVMSQNVEVVREEGGMQKVCYEERQTKFCLSLLS